MSYFIFLYMSCWPGKSKEFVLTFLIIVLITFLNLVAYNVIVCLLSSIFMNSRKFESIINCPLWNSQTSSRLSWTSGVPKGLRASSVLLLLDFYRVCCNKSLELSENVFRMGFSSRLKHKSSRLFLS